MVNEKVALVTGASSGIGKAIASMLEEEGYYVFVSARRGDLLDAMSSDKVIALPMDVTSDRQVAEGIEFVMQTLGKIDVLVNCAGYGMYSSLEEASMDWAQVQFEVNYFGVARVTQAVLPHMREARSGLIINVSSIVGQVSGAFMGHYCASKHALDAFTHALRMEVEPFGLHVTMVQPGVTQSGFEQVALQQLADSRSVYAYDAMAKAFVKSLQKIFIKADQPAKVAEVVRKVVCAKKPARRYVVGAKNKSLLLLRRVSGYGFIDRYFKRMMGL